MVTVRSALTTLSIVIRQPRVLPLPLRLDVDQHRRVVVESL